MCWATIRLDRSGAVLSTIAAALSSQLDSIPRISAIAAFHWTTLVDRARRAHGPPAPPPRHPPLAAGHGPGERGAGAAVRGAWLARRGGRAGPGRRQRRQDPGPPARRDRRQGAVDAGARRLAARRPDRGRGSLYEGCRDDPPRRDRDRRGPAARGRARRADRRRIDRSDPPR